MYKVKVLNFSHFPIVIVFNSHSIMPNQKIDLQKRSAPRICIDTRSITTVFSYLLNFNDRIPPILWIRNTNMFQTFWTWFQCCWFLSKWTLKPTKWWKFCFQTITNITISQNHNYSTITTTIVYPNVDWRLR